MVGDDRTRSEQIRALLDEVDRVRRESEHLRSSANRAMKQTFWPDRRRGPGDPLPPDQPERRNDR